MAAPESMPWTPSASTVACAVSSAPGLERRQLLALPAAPLVAGADAAHGAALDEQALRVGLRQQHHAELLGALGHEAREPREREHVVALVVHGRRDDRQARRARARHEVDGLVLDRPVARHVLERRAREQLEQRRRLHDGARELVRADGAALVDERDRHLAEPLGDRGIVLEQLRQADRAGQPGRAAADDRDADLELLLGRRLGRSDDLGRRERRRVRSGDGRHAPIVLSRIGRGRSQRPSGTRCECHLARHVASTLSAMPIDLRSDTVTRPTPAMREAMATRAGRRRRLRRGRDRQRARAPGRRAVRPRGRAVRAVGDDGEPDRRSRSGPGQGDEVYAHRDCAHPDRRGRRRRRRSGARTRAACTARASRSTSRSCSTPCRWTRATSIARAPRLLCIENTHTGSGGRVWTGRGAGARDRARARARAEGAHGRRAARERGGRARLHAGRGERGGRQRVVLLLEGPGRAGRLDPRLLGRGDRARAPAAQAARRRHAAGRRARRGRASTRSSTTSSAWPTTTPARARSRSR